MAYQRSGFERIQPIIDSMLQLKKRELDMHEFDSPKDLAAARNLVYSYMHHHRVKDMFRISTPTPTTLQILRKESLSFSTTKIRHDTTIETFIVDHALDAPNEDVALELIRKHLDKSLWEQALQEWRRVCGRENGTCELGRV